MRALSEKLNSDCFIRRPFLLIALLFLSFSSTLAQICDCPAVNSCGPCQGGLTRVTLRYDGTGSPTITASDQGGTVFSGVVRSGETFAFSGSNPNDKFQGANITLRIGSNNTNIPSGCSGNEIGKRYGSFTLVAAQSKEGGALCCKPSDYDDDAPDFDNCPSDRSVNLPAGACTVAVTWTAPRVTDDCTIQSIESNYKPGDTFPAGNTTVRYTAKDKNGNTSSCTFVVSVIDRTQPVITNCPPTINIPTTGRCRAVATWTPPTANDNCTAVTLTSTHNPGDTFPVGTTKVTYTAKDTRGNTTTCTFDIHVTDNAGPIFTNCPSDITVTANNNCEAVVNWIPPSVDDNCTPSFMSSSHRPGSRFKAGTTTVTYSAVDMRGNRSTCSFNVTVARSETPILTNCPAPITVTADESGESRLVWDEPRAEVGCGNVTVKQTHTPGALFTIGNTKVEYTFTSDAGKITTCSFIVTVLKPQIVIEISKALTPNGDGIHDVWELANIEKYKGNTVLIIDRWGNTIFEASGYDNERVVWDGRNRQGAKVPTGTYFYIVEVHALDTVWKQKGSIEVIQ